MGVIIIIFDLIFKLTQNIQNSFPNELIRIIPFIRIICMLYHLAICVVGKKNVSESPS